MSRLSPLNDPHGCLDDYMNEQVAEAMHAAHLDEHEAYPQKGCEWCEAEAEAEREVKELAFLAKHTCDRCRKLVVPGFYCIECGEVPNWRESK